MNRTVPNRAQTVPMGTLPRYRAPVPTPPRGGTVRARWREAGRIGNRARASLGTLPGRAGDDRG